MGMDAKTVQQQLWDILGKPEKKQFAFDPIMTGKRIGAGRGEYWYGGAATGGDDGKESGDDKDKDSQRGKDEGGRQGDNGGDPRRDPAKGCPKLGQYVPGLKNMHDCATGRCVNVNFTLPPLPPPGWGEDCTPPKGEPPKDWTPKVYYRASYTKIWADGSRRQRSGTGNFKTLSEAARWLRENTIASVAPQADNPAYFASYSYAGDSYRDDRAKINGSWSLTKTLSNDPQWQIPPDTVPPYPDGSCSEIASTPNGFKAACEKYDNRLPPQLKGEYGALRLCDANGNEITISRHGRGWVYETAACTVTVNDSGVVDNVQGKTP